MDDVASVFIPGHDRHFEAGSIRAALVAVVQFRTGLSQKAARAASRAFRQGDRQLTFQTAFFQRGQPILDRKIADGVAKGGNASLVDAVAVLAMVL